MLQPKLEAIENTRRNSIQTTDEHDEWVENLIYHMRPWENGKTSDIFTRGYYVFIRFAQLRTAISVLRINCAAKPNEKVIKKAVRSNKIGGIVWLSWHMYFSK